MQLTKHFKATDFECKCDHNDCAKHGIKLGVVYAAQKVRDDLKKPVVATSGYRCEKHNRSVGGVSRSGHIKGECVDLAPLYGVKFSDFADSCRDHFDIVIEYKEDGFCHCRKRFK